MGGQHKFIVTIRGETDVDVHDIQDAVVPVIQAHEGDSISHGDVDVELVEAVDKPQIQSGTHLVYNVLDAA